MDFATLSRYRVHRMKSVYWADRMKLGKLNDLIFDREQHYGSREEARRHEDYNRLVMYRKTLFGRLKGIEDVFKQFDLEIERDAPPVVRDVDIQSILKAEELEESK